MSTTPRPLTVFCYYEHKKVASFSTYSPPPIGAKIEVFNGDVLTAYVVREHVWRHDATSGALTVGVTLADEHATRDQQALDAAARWLANVVIADEMHTKDEPLPAGMRSRVAYWMITDQRLGWPSYQEAFDYLNAWKWR